MSHQLPLGIGLRDNSLDSQLRFHSLYYPEILSNTTSNGQFLVHSYALEQESSLVSHRYTIGS